MKIFSHHSWHVTIEEARQIQFQIQSQLEIRPLTKKVELVAGADISFSKDDPRIFTAVAVLRPPDLSVNVPVLRGPRGLVFALKFQNFNYTFFYGTNT